MKLKAPGERTRRESAAHLLRTEEESDVWFDPVKELPVAEFIHLARKSEAEITHEQKLQVIHSAWLGVLDKSYTEALRASPWVRTFWKDFCYQFLSPHDAKPSFSTLKATYGRLAEFIQIFPEERTDERIKKEHLNTLLSEVNGSDATEQLLLGVDLSEVFPDEQARIAQHTYRRQFTPQQYAENALFFLPGKVDVSFVANEVNLMAFLPRMSLFLILFPEQRAQYAPLIQQLSQDLKQESLKDVSPGFGQTKEGILYKRLFHLTVLAAQDARIGADGQVQIGLKQKTLSRGAAVPERPHL